MTRPMTPQQFQKNLFAWFDKHGRKDLPWQKNITPYRVWVSEIMLQQTQVTTVISYFKRFIKQFPSITALAKASENDVLHLWTGLGYYARARNLHKTAKIIHSELKGIFPDTVEELETMPGIGHSTAGAIISISFGKRAAILDGNVKRVLTRFAGIQTWPGETETLQKLWNLSEQLTPKQRSADYTQAIMDLGATLCTQRRPRCEDCPLKKDCVAKANNLQEHLPAKKASKKNPTKELFFILLENKNGEILLEQRPATGIWGGLWSLPEYADLKNIRKIISNQYNLTAGTPELLPDIKHTFSHYHLILKPVRFLCHPEGAAYPEKVLTSAHPEEMRNIVSKDISKNVARPSYKKQDPSIPLRSTQDDRIPYIWYKPSSETKIGLAAPIKKLLSHYEKNDSLPKTKNGSRSTGSATLPRGTRKKNS